MTEYIPKAIMNNPNIDLKDDKNMNYLSDLFSKLKLDEDYDINNDSYNNLIIEINARINSEYEYNKKLKLKNEKELELNALKKELDELIVKY